MRQKIKISLPSVEPQYAMALSPQWKHPSGISAVTSQDSLCIQSQPPFSANSETHWLHSDTKEKHNNEGRNK